MGPRGTRTKKGRSKERPLNVYPATDSAAGRGRVNGNLHSLLVLVLELHHAIHQRKDGVISAESDVLAGTEFGAPLPDDNVSGEHLLSTVALHAEILRIGIASVAAGADALLVSHCILSRPSRR